LGVLKGTLPEDVMAAAKTPYFCVVVDSTLFYWLVPIGEVVLIAFLFRFVFLQHLSGPSAVLASISFWRSNLYRT